MALYTLLTESSERPSKQYDDHDSSASASDLFLEKNRPLQPQKPFYRRHIRLIALHSLLFTINLMIGLAVWYRARNTCAFGVNGPGLVYSKFNAPREPVAKRNLPHSTGPGRHSIRCTNLGFHWCLLQKRLSQPEQVAQGTWTAFS